MDGYVTIGTLVDTKEFDAQITYIESKITDNIKISDNSFILNYKDAKNYDYNNFLKT